MIQNLKLTENDQIERCEILSKVSAKRLLILRVCVRSFSHSIRTIKHFVTIRNLGINLSLRSVHVGTDNVSYRVQETHSEKVGSLSKLVCTIKYQGPSISRICIQRDNRDDSSGQARTDSFLLRKHIVRARTYRLSDLSYGQ